VEFRRFLEDRKKVGDVDIVTDEISCREIPGRIQAEEKAQNRVIVFENVAGYRGAVVGNVFGSRGRINRSTGATDTASFYGAIDRAIAAPQEPDFVAFDASDYVVSANPSLKDRLPQIIHSEHDATPYITSGVVLARHPETGRHHMCFVRLSVLEDNRVFFNPRTPRIKEIADKTVGRGEDLNIVVLIGAAPVITLLGGLGITDEIDEVAFAQAWGGGGLKFHDLDLPVPAATEMVLFGRVHPGDQTEGPFGDMRGLYVTNPNPICQITEMWERKDARYHSVLGGMSHEHIGLVTLKSRHELERMKAHTPGFVDYRLPHYSAGQMGLITVTKEVSKEDLIEELRSISLTELFILLNEDTVADIPGEVLWALTQRAGAQSDYTFNAGDPAKNTARHTVIDATAEDLTDLRNVRVRVFE
jgi:UbiD family decarboxylase